MGCGKSSGPVQEVTFSSDVKSPPQVPATSSIAPELNETNKEDDLASASRPLPEAFRLTDLAGHYRTPGREQLLRLEYVYGYSCRCRESNLFYLSTGDIVVYPCASLAVLLSVSSNTQKFLGAGEVHRAKGHLGRIASLAISRDRDLIATGEAGYLPSICIWKLPGSDPFRSIELPSPSKGTAILSFSEDSKLLLSVDFSEEQTIRVYDLATGTLAAQSVSRPGLVLSAAWSCKELKFVTVGEGHFAIWTMRDGGVQRVDVSEGRKDLRIVRFLPNGEFVTAADDGKIYQWSGAQLQSSYQVLPANTRITALSIVGDSVVVGSELCKIHILDSRFSETQNIIDTSGQPLSLDQSSNGILCGTSEGTIVLFGKSGRTVLMDSHSEGSLQAVALDTGVSGLLLTCGGDNRLKAWDLHYHKCTASGLVEVGKEVSCAQALAISAKGTVAVGHADGHFTLRAGLFQLNQIHSMCRRKQGCVTALAFSPSCKLLALGDSTGTVEIYRIQGGCERVAEAKRHHKEVITLDWSITESFVRSQDTEQTVSFWSAESCQIASESSILSEIWTRETITKQSRTRLKPFSCAKSPLSDLFVQGLSSGLLELHNPNISPVPLSFKAHSDEVRALVWTSDGRFLVSAGGADLGLMLWQLASAI